MTLRELISRYGELKSEGRDEDDEEMLAIKTRLGRMAHLDVDEEIYGFSAYLASHLGNVRERIEALEAEVDILKDHPHD